MHIGIYGKMEIPLVCFVSKFKVKYFQFLLPSVCLSTLNETFFRQIGLVCCQSSLMPKGRDFAYECHIIV